MTNIQRSNLHAGPAAGPAGPGATIPQVSLRSPLTDRSQWLTSIGFSGASGIRTSGGSGIGVSGASGFRTSGGGRVGVSGASEIGTSGDGGIGRANCVSQSACHLAGGIGCDDLPAAGAARMMGRKGRRRRGRWRRKCILLLLI